MAPRNLNTNEDPSYCISKFLLEFVFTMPSLVSTCDCLTELIRNELSIHTPSGAVIRWHGFRRITWKFTQPNPALARRGRMFRCQQLSFDNGVMASEGKNPQSASVENELN